MHKMLLNRNCFTALLAANVLAVVIGCGGSGGGGGNLNGSTSSTGSQTSAWKGNYVGDFVDQSNTIADFSMLVAANGSVSGTFAYTTPITFQGSINTSGKGTITDSKGTFQITLGKAGAGTLGGGIGTTTNGAFFTTVTNPTGQYSGIMGGWFGTVHNNTKNLTGIMAVSITPNSSTTVNFDGVQVLSVSGKPTLVTDAGYINTGSEITYSVAGLTVNGTIATSGTQLTANVNESDGDTAAITLNQIQ